MNLESKTVQGYEFINIAEAYICTTGLDVTHEGRKFKWHIALDIDEKWLQAEQSTYLIYENEKLVYAGYYSDTFQKRWRLKRKKYIWHSDNIDDNIKKSLDNKKSITVWLSLNPYIETINISKHIEDDIIKNILNNDDNWNTVGKTKTDAKKVIDLFNK